ncbi:hypothetical protein BX070DRAFT_218302 [Coemansia spiralis]|nr:hypothetical protein BX070DRAFT_218302 [Coemansia spiralis]
MFGKKIIVAKVLCGVSAYAAVVSAHPLPSLIGDGIEPLSVDNQIQHLSVAGATEVAILTATNPPKRSGNGSFPVRDSAFSGGDSSLSDTKIFVLLAAIVFIFLIALGVAMARVSRNRRRHHSESITQQVVTTHRTPETLNKTILDLLPVFEVTDKHRLRQLQTCSPRDIALRECFADGSSEYSMQYMPNVCRGESSTPNYPTPVKSRGQSAGYGLDSRANSPRSLSIHDSRQCREEEGRCQGRLPGEFPEMQCSAQGGVEPSEWPNKTDSKRPERRNQHRSASPTTPFSIDMPPAAAIRYYRSIPSQDATSSGPTRCPSAGVHWDDMMLGNNNAYMNTGTVVFRERGSRSLDLSPDRQTAVPLDHSLRSAQPPAWDSSHSQPEITHKHTRCRSMAASDGGGGLGSCPICLEEFDVGEQVRELPCLHRYHVICIDTWLVSRSTCCPYCKLDIRRWYYGPALEDGIPHSSPIDSDSLPFDFREQELAIGIDSSTLAVQDMGRDHSRRRIHRHRRSRSRRQRGGLHEAWVLLRAVFTSDIHYTTSMHPH